MDTSTHSFFETWEETRGESSLCGPAVFTDEKTVHELWGETRGAPSMYETEVHDHWGGTRGEPSLHEAAASGDEKAVRRLVARGADVNALDAEGKTVIACLIIGNRRVTQRLRATSPIYAERSRCPLQSERGLERRVERVPSTPGPPGHTAFSAGMLPVVAVHVECAARRAARRDAARDGGVPKPARGRFYPARRQQWAGVRGCCGLPWRDAAHVRRPRW